VIGHIVIDDIRPRTPSGAYPAKAVVGEKVVVSADVFADGHDILRARVRWRPLDNQAWEEVAMQVDNAGLDRWSATIVPTTLGRHEFIVEAWIDLYATWRHRSEAKLNAGQEIDAEPAAKKSAVTSSEPVSLWVDRERALFSSWYEFFPRSEGGLQGARDRLPAVAAMGFDVVYFPPIHPIGRQFRKGPNNSLVATGDDPGSPWAIGGPEGGHTAIHPDLGTFSDFDDVVHMATELGVEIALDYALQCSPDHPWVSEHPEWFHHRPDGSIAYAENPPKKYQDIHPLNFWPDKEADRKRLWDACKGILDFWIAKGVRIFRVDNPHTKPLAFWEWCINAVQSEHPDVLFLAEAFTQPRMMAKLAEVGFTQSYTYFTWRTGKSELTEYVEQLASAPLADFMRPNFWPNTPDILAGVLRNGPPAAFRIRSLLAATLTPSYGIYSGFELLENEPMSDANEEYFHSEKYEIRRLDHDDPRSIAPWLAALNDIRRRHPALQRLRNVTFHGAANDDVIAYSKVSEDGADAMLVVVNLNPWQASEATLDLDVEALGFPLDRPYEAYDELNRQSFTWQGPHPYVRLDPYQAVAHVLHLRQLS